MGCQEGLGLISPFWLVGRHQRRPTSRKTAKELLQLERGSSRVKPEESSWIQQRQQHYTMSLLLNMLHKHVH